MRSIQLIRLLLIGLALIVIAVNVASARGKDPRKGGGERKGLSGNAFKELSDAGVDKYLETSSSVESDFGVWTKHTFDREFTPDASYPSGFRPDGPVCIAGTEYSVFTRAGDPKKLLIFLQGGGACWEGFYNCNILAEDQAPPEAPPFPGVFDSSSSDNPFADYSIVYMPYCDGSAFGGDNDVNDGNFPYGQTRHHRGVRNLSAGMDVAGGTFPDAKHVTVMGHSAGGVGVAAFAPFLARFVYGNQAKLTVHNDAGPIVVNLGTSVGPPFFCADPNDLSCLSVVARAFDWEFAQFYPASCILDGRCDAFGQQTGIIDWRLENDSTIREAFYETDSDRTNRFFAQGDGSLMDPEVYRNLILTEHGALNDAYPKRYKRFIVSADDTHGAVQVTAPTPNFPSRQPFLFYTQEANGVLLSDWIADFVRQSEGDSQEDIWKDIVEDYVPVPIP
ncbi:MAG: hypothetical protein JRF15_03500 [Deltaproteobacteria bacterium]|jgi:hypothetical protein|nr:hypothetical protein [Deltaproteobacteria bacterium]